MMALVRLRGIQLFHGPQPLLDHADLTIERGERICLLGRNGAGKSTLMKIISGEVQADGGDREIQPGLRITRLTQEVPAGLEGDVFDVVAGGLGDLGTLMAEYHHISRRLAESTDPSLLKALEQVQHRLETSGGWEREQRVETVISRLSLDADTVFDHLSGGLKRRVLLARALVKEPDLLLLDEPTNHLDIPSIAWLEEFLLTWQGTLLFVTHDRSFLRRLATRIVELDRGRLTSWPGDYETYLRRKAETLAAEEKQNAEFDKKLAREEAWIRQGIKARRTRNEGRVRALKKLREERRERRERTGTARLRLQEADRSGKIVIEAENIGYQWDGRPIFKGLDITLLRGDKVGIIGPNGCGKTTLLKVLLGDLPPDSGTVRLGTRLEVAYFDQMRAQLDDDKTVLDNLAEGRERITIDGQSKHVLGYLQDFLFTPERARAPVSTLSGGERNRLLLAKLFTKPANVLVLDEPTNDLDMETLELLEELVIGYQGTLLLVSHDRAFLDNVVTSTLVFEGDGVVNEYVGGYEDWLRQRKPPGKAETKPAAKTEKGKAAAPRKRKLGYKEQRELEQLPGRIEALEEEQERLHGQMADPGFYRQDGGTIAATRTRLEEVERELAQAYERWEQLEG